ncbi:MAG: hypothetical protein K5853_02530 [Lachnospiraceae bacterium]|nr:hypothetical protein [Lachnospiraceae bacterium]
MDYKNAYEKYVQMQMGVHEANQKRIRVGLKVNIFLPLVFLFLSFVTNGSKLVFLILWIVSLFGIAAYLIYVEYMDYKLQEQLADFNGEKDEIRPALIGANVEAAEEQISHRIDRIDDIIEESRQKVAEKIESIIDSDSEAKPETKEKDND